MKTLAVSFVLLCLATTGCGLGPDFSGAGSGIGAAMFGAAGAFDGARTAMKPDGATLTVLTWDASEHDDLDRLIAMTAQIDASQPDIICLQAAAPDTVNNLLAALDGTYAAAGTDTNGEVILVRSGHVEVVAAFGDALGVVQSYAGVHVSKNGAEFMVYTTRLDATDADVRSGQLQELLSVTGPGSMPVILAGDFNIDPDHPGYLSIGMAGYDSATVPPSATDDGSVFHRGGFVELDVRVLDDGTSEHNGVIVEFVLP